MVRNLILLIIDTLRADFELLCAEHSIEIGSFAQLARHAPQRPKARCGSFPTGPMRTDLLTGELAFLRGEWALPRLGEETLVSQCRKSGFRTCLVTDNYVAVIPRVGGMLIDLFDSVDFIRGAAADPWTTPSAELLHDCREREWSFPTRSPIFEAQFRANAARLVTEGKSHTEQLFRSATEQLVALQGHDRFVLWVDCFSCHEPWVPSDGLRDSSDIPLFPGYVSSAYYSEEHLSRLQSQYASRIGETSVAMHNFVSAVITALKGGDTALVVLSDHGFLFGEFGFVGKPAETPLPPQLHEIVCWLSNHFDTYLTTGDLGLQPHMIHGAILSVLGFSRPKPQDPGLHIFGRNSPRSDFLAAADFKGLTILRKAKGKPTLSMLVPWEQLDESIPLVAHGSWSPPTSSPRALSTLIRKGQSDWLDSFFDDK